MNGKERISRILRHEKVDRIGLYEHFWSDTMDCWTSQGYIQEGESMEDHFGYDIQTCWSFNMVADLDFKPLVIEETEEKYYSEFLEDLLKYTVKLKEGSKVRLRKNSEYALQHDGIGILCGNFTPEHEWVDVRWEPLNLQWDLANKFPNASYREKDLEPAEIPEENKRKIEEIRKEVEFKHKLNSYDEIMAETIKEGVKQMQVYGMSQDEIRSFF